MTPAVHGSQGLRCRWCTAAASRFHIIKNPATYKCYAFLGVRTKVWLCDDCHMGRTPLDTWMEISREEAIAMVVLES